MNFSDLSLIPALLRAVTEAGYTAPSPIQEKAIPPALTGKDLLACAQTGTGKTAAFSLPILQMLAARAPLKRNAIRALILTPTRELALQISESLEVYGKYLPMRSTVIFGGVGQAPQVKILKKGVDILVATPGRLNDLIGQGFIDLSHIEIFVLDEADRMLDMGFVHDVKKVLALLPKEKQTLLFSATMPNEIIQLANGLLHSPTKIFVTPVSSTVDAISQCLYKVDKANKRHLLAHLIKENNIDRALVFCRTKHGCDRVVRELTRAGVKAMAIHGNKSQTARQKALAEFKNGEITALVATDIAARGLDIDELSHVFNYDLPNPPETYVHRIGRTGRAGKDGTSISFCCVDELEYLEDIQRLIGFAIPEETGHSWPMEILEKSVKKQGDVTMQQQNNQNRREKQAPNKNSRQPNPKNGKPQPQQAANPAKNPTQGGKGKNQAAPSKNPNPRQNRAEQAVAQNTGKPAQNSGKPAQNTGNRNQKTYSKKRQGGNRPAPFDPYDNLTGGKAIVTKRPVWSQGDTETAAPVATKAPSAPTAPVAPAATAAQPNQPQGGTNAKKNKNNNVKRPAPAAPVEKKHEETPKGEKGVYNFSEDELAQDSSLKVISRKQTGTKYASFEDFLKDL